MIEITSANYDYEIPVGSILIPNIALAHVNMLALVWYLFVGKNEKGQNVYIKSAPVDTSPGNIHGQGKLVIEPYYFRGVCLLSP